MNSNVAHLFIMVAIIAGAAFGVLLVMLRPLIQARLRAARAGEAAANLRELHDRDWQKSYDMLWDAADAVIGELEARPATYDLFPVRIRELLDSAHDRARELEKRREGLSHR